jgi:hypothetical protein
MNKTLIAGDLAYNQVHTFLAGAKTDGWLMDLEGVRHLGPIDTVVPGHGQAGGVEVLINTGEYIKTFAMVADRAKSADEARREMLKLFPDHRVPFFLDRAVQSRFPKPGD